MRALILYNKYDDDFSSVVFDTGLDASHPLNPGNSSGHAQAHARLSVHRPRETDICPELSETGQMASTVHLCISS